LCGELVPEAAFEQGEGAGGLLAEVGGQPGDLVVGQHAAAHVFDQRTVDAYERVRHHLRADVSALS
jgi:hypothetical protein